MRVSPVFALHFAAICAFFAGVARAGEPPPDTYAEERYSQLMSDSPFALATPPPAPPPPERSFAEGWVVIGLWQEKAADGTVVEKATIRTSEAKTFTLAGHDADPDGVSISAVKWSDKPFASSLTLKKGAEFANVEFIDPAQQSAPPMSPQVPMPIRPGMPGRSGVPRPSPPVNSTNRIPRPMGGPGVNPRLLPNGAPR